ncbi:MAG: patatin-like phospholipase family protein, partial [Planctomycetota bacterium]
MAKKRKVALIISGGGVRGAYAVGVIKELLPRLWERGEEVDIYCGSSIGSLTTCYLASKKRQDINEVVEELEDIWLNLTMNNVLKEDWLSVIRFCTEMLGTPKMGFKSFCDSTPLRNLLNRYIDWDKLNRNVDRGDVKLVALSATSLLTGNPTVFYRENKKEYAGKKKTNTFVRFVRSKFSVQHVMASSSVPLVFPYEKIEDDYYADGGMVLNTPIHPLLCFDRDIKVIVISLHYPKRGALKPPKAPAPRLPIVLGKFLHFYLLSNTFLDVARLSRVNQMLVKMKKERLGDFKVIPYLYIHPSHDISKLAEKFLYKTRGLKDLKLTGYLSRLRSVPPPLLGELLTYIMFDKDYIRSVIKMGEHDA